MKGILFKIYLTGLNSRNKELVSAFRETCARMFEHAQYQILVVDILKNPGEAERNKILATPTIVRDKPLPAKRIIGDFRDNNKAEQALSFLTDDLTNHS